MTQYAIAIATNMTGSSRNPPIGWIVILASAVAIGPLSIDMYLPALPELERALHTDAAAVQWTLSAFFIGIASGQLLYGPLSDRFGRKPPLLIGLALFILASIGCAFAPNIDSLIGLRLVQALGGCAGTVITRAMVRDRFAPQDMARILSLLVLVMGIAPILAPLIGSAVLAFAGWPAIFLVLAAFGALCFAVIGLLVEESHPHTRRLASVSVGSAIRGYQHLLSHRRFVGYALSGAAAQSGMFAYITVSAFVFIEHYGLSPTQFSWLFGSNAFGLIAASQLNGWLLRRYRAQMILRRALQTYFVSGVAMTLCAATDFGGLYGVALPLWLCIASLGFTFPNSVAAAMAPFGDRAGSASALLGTMQFGGAGAASYVVGHLYNGTALPMAAIIAFCGGLSVLVLRSLAQSEG